MSSPLAFFLLSPYIYSFVNSRFKFFLFSMKEEINKEKLFQSYSSLLVIFEKI